MVGKGEVEQVANLLAAESSAIHAIHGAVLSILRQKPLMTRTAATAFLGVRSTGKHHIERAVPTTVTSTSSTGTTMHARS